MLTEISQSQEGNYSRIHVHEFPGIVKSPGAGSRMGAAGIGGRGIGEFGFPGDRVSVWEDKTIQEMVGAEGYTATQAYLMPRPCTLQNG